MISASSGRHPVDRVHKVVNFSIPIPVIPRPLSRQSMSDYIGNTYELEWRISGDSNRNVRTLIKVANSGSNISVGILHQISNSDTSINPETLPDINTCKDLEKFIFARSVEFIFNPETKEVVQSEMNNCNEDDDKKVHVKAKYRLQQQN